MIAPPEMGSEEPEVGTKPEPTSATRRMPSSLNERMREPHSQSKPESPRNFPEEITGRLSGAVLLHELVNLTNGPDLWMIFVIFLISGHPLQSSLRRIVNRIIFIHDMPFGNDLAEDGLPIAVALCEERSVTGAARRLDTSRLRASKALAKLRTSLEDQLFIKTSSGMEPTSRAASLIEASRETLFQVQRNVLSRTTLKPGSTEAVFRVALSEAGELLWLPKLISALRSRAPRAPIISVFRAISELSDGLGAESKSSQSA